MLVLLAALFLNVGDMCCSDCYCPPPPLDPPGHEGGPQLLGSGAAAPGLHWGAWGIVDHLDGATLVRRLDDSQFGREVFARAVDLGLLANEVTCVTKVGVGSTCGIPTPIGE